MLDNPEEGELDPADDVCRRCIKNSPSVLSYRHFTRVRASSSDETEESWQKRKRKL